MVGKRPRFSAREQRAVVAGTVGLGRSTVGINAEGYMVGSYGGFELCAWGMEGI